MFYLGQQQRLVEVLRAWGKLMRNLTSSDKRWQTAFCVLMMLVLSMDKTIDAAWRKCDYRRRQSGSANHRRLYKELVKLMYAELFERCKEIFHVRYKTRKSQNERINPIRDGIKHLAGQPVDHRAAVLIEDMRRIMRDNRMSLTPTQSPLEKAPSANSPIQETK